jgi:hypothetical protein
MISRKVIAADFENYTKLINILCGEIGEPFNVTAGGRLYIYLWLRFKGMRSFEI